MAQAVFAQTSLGVELAYNDQNTQITVSDTVTPYKYPGEVYNIPTTTFNTGTPLKTPNDITETDPETHYALNPNQVESEEETNQVVVPNAVHYNW